MIYAWSEPKESGGERKRNCRFLYEMYIKMSLFSPCLH